MHFSWSRHWINCRSRLGHWDWNWNLTMFPSCDVLNTRMKKNHSKFLLLLFQCIFICLFTLGQSSIFNQRNGERNWFLTAWCWRCLPGKLEGWGLKGGVLRQKRELEPVSSVSWLRRLIRFVPGVSAWGRERSNGGAIYSCWVEKEKNNSAHLFEREMVDTCVQDMTPNWGISFLQV